MGLLDSLFGGSSGPSSRKIDAAQRALEHRHGEPARRYEAMEKLASWNTPEATEALLKRFTFASTSTTSDEEEKARVAELLQAKGRDAVEPLVHYLKTEEELAWPLRVLHRILPEDEFRDRATDVLAGIDVQFDRTPTRKVELIHALAPHAHEQRVAETIAAFLEDTDDRVQIAAVEVLASNGRPEDQERLTATLIEADERPRVRSAICSAMAAHAVSVKGRKAEVEPLLPEGYYLTRDGVVKRLGTAE